MLEKIHRKRRNKEQTFGKLRAYFSEYFYQNLKKLHFKRNSANILTYFNKTLKNGFSKTWNKYLAAEFCETVRF